MNGKALKISDISGGNKAKEEPDRFAPPPTPSMSQHKADGVGRSDRPLTASGNG